MAIGVVEQVIPSHQCLRGWSAIDVDAEEKIERDLRRPLSWRQALYRWLYEYNKY